MIPNIEMNQGDFKMTWKLWPAVFSLFLSPLIQAAPEATITVYSERKDHLIKPVFEAYTKKTGVKVTFLTDNTATLIQRIQVAGSEGWSAPGWPSRPRTETLAGGASGWAAWSWGGGIRKARRSGYSMSASPRSINKAWRNSKNTWPATASAVAWWS